MSGGGDRRAANGARAVLKERPQRPTPGRREAQAEYVLKQVKNCTYMAVTHLAARLKVEDNPHLRLLHEMCFKFMKNRNEDIFSLVQSPASPRQQEAPITDIGITFQGKHPEPIPSHYELLKNSVAGGKGDLCLHGPKSPYIYFRRSFEEKPITAVTLVSPDLGEEPPLGFSMISRTPGARDANLCLKTRSPNLFLCIHRGEGPPLTHIAVVHTKSEKIPPGFHPIARQPTGRTPDLDMGQTLICYRRDYRQIIMRFAKYQDSKKPEDKYLARCFACLVGGIFSYHKNGFLFSLEAFTSLDSVQEFPPGMLSDFMTLVLDAITAYISYFNREVYIKVLKWLGHVYRTRNEQLDTMAFMSILHLCMFLRHDDAREQMSKSILSEVINSARKQRKARKKPPKPTETYDMMDRIVREIVVHVGCVKATEQSVVRFLNAKVIDHEFHTWVSQMTDFAFDEPFDRFMIAAGTLLAKVSAQHLPAKLTPKSEAIKRRIHALKLLAVFLDDAGFFFKNNVPALVVLRRIIFTSFIHSAITPVPAVFKTMFRLHEILWLHYRQHLKFEIGVLLDTGLKGLLSSQFCTPPQKVDLLDGLTQMFRNKAALINIFYNYDNDVQNWPVCQQLVATVARLTEGEYHTSNHYGLSENRVVQGALRLLARFMELMAKYLKAPNLTAGGNLDDQEDFDQLGRDYVHSNVRAYDFLSANLSNDAPVALSDMDDRERAGSEVTLKELATLAPDTMSVSSIGDDGSSAVGSGDRSSVHERPSMLALTTPPSNGAPNLPEFDDLGSLGGRDRSMGKTSRKSAAAPIPEEEETKKPDGETEEDHQPAINLHEQGRQHVWEEHKSVDEEWGNIPTRQNRANTWNIRYHRHQEEKKVVDEALKKARQEKLKNGIKFLIAQGGRFATLKFIATFLHSNETLDKAEVGEFIGMLESSSFNQSQHKDLRNVYVGLLNFTGMTYDGAFRHFLTDCGFRLPKEAQKIDRLIDMFSHGFTRDNPHVLADQDQALMLSYAALMLNTELHDPRVQANSMSHEPMTKEQFMNLVKPEGPPIPPKLLSDLYDSIKENPIEMRTFHQYSNEDVQEIQKQFRSECVRLQSQAQAKLRSYATKKHTWHKAPNIRIVRGLYDVTWHQFLAAITTVLRQTKDPQTQSECLEAIKFSCCTAIQLSLDKPELHAFASDLAKFVYMEEHKYLIQSACHLSTVKGEHLKQPWFLRLTELSKEAPHVGCEIVSRICNDMQQRVVYDHDQKILREIEHELNDELYLVHPDRRFIRQGPLIKQSQRGELVKYQFYLFNDLLIYALESRGKLQVHRVLRLSLCRIADLKDGFVRNIKNAFRIVSPQKPVILIAETATLKREWFQSIQMCIEEQLEFRQRWINENFQTLQDIHETARVSRFLGRVVQPKRHELKRVQAGEQMNKSKMLNADVKEETSIFQRQPPCKLCMKPFKGLFARKTKCPWCLHIVSKDCFNRRAHVPTMKNPMKVCDGCFGAINYFVADMNHTNVEFSVTENSVMDTSRRM